MSSYVQVNLCLLNMVAGWSMSRYAPSFCKIILRKNTPIFFLCIRKSVSDNSVSYVLHEEYEEADPFSHGLRMNSS